MSETTVGLLLFTKQNKQENSEYKKLKIKRIKTKCHFLSNDIRIFSLWGGQSPKNKEFVP